MSGEHEPPFINVQALLSVPHGQALVTKEVRAGNLQLTPFPPRPKPTLSPEGQK